MSGNRESLSPAPAPAERSVSRRRSLGVADAAAAMDQIKVICRFRPPVIPQPGTKLQLRAGMKPDHTSFKLNTENSSIEFTSDFQDTKFFKFDRVFGTDCTQMEVFETVSGVVGSVMSGFNGTIMAYGQTSAGKSFTMEGPSLWDTTAQGIMPRCIDTLFQLIEDTDETVQFQLLVSYYEIYCEKVRDLLNPSAVNLKIRETKADGFVVQDITEVSCTDREEVLRIIELGKANRASAPTLMNAESSRSHSIVTILVDQQDTKTGRQRRGSLFLVDLAGSEKVSKTGAKGLRLEEAKNINSSLTTLGMVINSLCDGSPHVPYRDSKLTQLLMEALGGNSKTTLIVCCTPEYRHTPETLSTLRFGERAKRIKNNAKVNEELSPDELKVLLQSARKDVVLLKRKVKKFAVMMAQSLLEDDTSSMQQQLLGLQSLVSDVANADIEGDDCVITGSSSGGDDTAAVTIFPSSNSEQQLHNVDSVDSDGHLNNNGNSNSGKENSTAHRNGSISAGVAAAAAAKEIADLNSKIRQLEDELETEKERYSEEHQQLLEITVESTALKATISELEEKLLQNTLQTKRSMAWNNANLSATGRSDNSSLELSPDQYSSRNGQSQRQKSRSLSDAPAAAADESAAAAAVRATTAVDRETSNTDDPSSSNNTAAAALQRTESTKSVDGPSQRSTMMTVEELASHGFALRSELEEDLEILTEGFNEKSAEARHANEIARQYAERYMKLREDYETHVQRLMLKVTQEQQTRIQLEDRLEEALHDASARPKKSSRNFFNWFSRGGESENRRHSMAFEYEGSSSSSLEVAQFRIAQLSSELEANKEAQIIVLETKESVMRSLARQNTELTLEKDAMAAKIEELTSKTEQMSNLIRSFQQQHSQSLAASTATGSSGNSSGGNLSRSGSGYGNSSMMMQQHRGSAAAVAALSGGSNGSGSGGILGVGGHNSRVRSIALTPRAASIIKSGGAFKFGLSSSCITGGQSHDSSSNNSNNNGDGGNGSCSSSISGVEPPVPQLQLQQRRQQQQQEDSEDNSESPLPRAQHRVITSAASLTPATAPVSVGNLFPAAIGDEALDLTAAATVVQD